MSEPNYYFLGVPDIKAYMGYGFLADGVPEVQKATREVFRLGSSHVKIMAGGGVATVYDPLDGLQFTPEEIRAIVVEAEKVGLVCHGAYLHARSHHHCAGGRRYEYRSRHVNR